MILEKVKKILSSHFSIDETSITPETNIAEDLGADSLDVIDLLMSVEEEFKIEVPDEDAEKVKTVSQMVEYIKERLGDR